MRRRRRPAHTPTGRIPLHVADSIVNRTFPEIARVADHKRRLSRVALDVAVTAVQPVGVQLTIAINELHELQIGELLEQACEPRVRARAAVKPLDVSRFSTVAPRGWATSILPSIEPESTYTTRGTSNWLLSPSSGRKRSPSLRPIATAPTCRRLLNVAICPESRVCSWC